MKTIDELKTLVLDKTGGFLFVNPTDEDVKDIDNLLKANISKVLNSYAYPFLKKFKKLKIKTEGTDFFYLDLPEGSLIDVTLDHPSRAKSSIQHDSDIDLNIIGNKLYFDEKPANEVYVTFIPYVEIKDDFKLNDTLVDPVVYYTYADYLDQQGKTQEAQIARMNAKEFETQAIYNTLKTQPSKFIFKR